MPKLATPSPEIGIFQRASSRPRPLSYLLENQRVFFLGGPSGPIGSAGLTRHCLVATIAPWRADSYAQNTVRILSTLNDPIEGRCGPEVERTSAFCNAVAFLTDVKVGGYAVGLLFLFAAIMVTLTAHSYFDSLIPMYVLVAALSSGEVSHIVLCKRESPLGHLLKLFFRYLGLGISAWVAVSYLGVPSVLGVLVICTGPFIGTKAFDLLRKVHRQD